ncbi:Acetyl-CoA acetyltransferase [Tistlia consotensis]|uniref:Acetyl-CoA acetyltransferase n=2 Tax=Tistlia TaxID=1321364 RepID=A0A1Y6BY41_9PROT|nr:Acetyl-CoA acetyltransferase [Tistlia consotensis USBA 355]SNR70852.1 Acetyl-CoA acetyltransferase [Tistlia consotensis]
MSSSPLRDAACMAGIGTTAYGSFPDNDTYGLGAEALLAALDDCGLELADIDGLIVNRIPSYERFAEMMGISPRFCLQTDSPGRYSAVSLMLATQAIATGAAEVVALVYGNNGRSNRVFYGGGEGEWAPWGMSSPGASHAMQFQAHMARFGTRSEDLGHVSVAFRKHARLNPQAVMRKPITLEDHDSSRFICEPLRLLDYCLINDGGVAWIVTTPERAKDLRKKPVYVSGYARQDVYESTPRLDCWYPELKRIEARVYENAGIGRDEIDGLMIYDNFSPTVLFALEGLGFCGQGEAGDFVKDGTLELGRGRWPTNTSGGHLSESYMQGWALIAEAVRQLRGECGERQIPDARAIQFIAATPISSSIIFRRD